MGGPTFRTIAAAAIAVALAACGGQRYRLSEVPHPIVMGASPFIGDATHAPREVGTYRGGTSEEVFAAGSSYGSSYGSTEENAAQLEACRALGGQDDRAIVNLEIDVSERFVFLVSAFWNKVSVEGNGRVVDYDLERAPR